MSTDDYGGGGGGTTTSTTPAPFNPDDEIPSSFDRGSSGNPPCGSPLANTDLSGPDFCYLQGLSFTADTYTSVGPNGETYQANGRRAYRRLNWSLSTKMRGWIYFDSKSACWRFSPQGTETSPYDEEFEPVEYFDNQGNSIGFKIPDIQINLEERNCVLAGAYIKPACDSDSSPVGDWYCPIRPLSEQEVDPTLSCYEGKRPYNSYTPVGGSLSLTSAASCAGSYKIEGDENNECSITYFEPTPNEVTDAKSTTKVLKLNDDGTCIWGANNPTPRTLEVGDSVKFDVINGKSIVKMRFTYLKIGSGIGSIGPAGGDGDITLVGSLDSQQETIGGGFSCDTNRIQPKEKYICREGEGVDLAEGLIGNTHSTFTYALYKSATITIMEGGFESVDVTYEGVVESEFVKISVNTNTTTEPIDTHEEFCDFAGNKQKPKNGAIFNDDGTFKGFEIFVDNERNEFAGVKSYLVPSVEVTETIEYSDCHFKDAEDIGKICKPKKDSLTELDVNYEMPKKTTFLCTGVKWQSFGVGCIVTKTYRLSGPNGWDKDIYERA